MDLKKNKVLSKLAKPLFKIGRKAKKTPLRYRRSISVPDLRCDQSPSPELDAIIQHTDPDSASTGVESSDHDETESETSSLALSENIPATDSRKCPEPEAHFPSMVISLAHAPSTTPPAKLPNASPAPKTPSPEKGAEQFSLPGTPPSYRFSMPEILAVTERPPLTPLHIRKERADRKTEERDRTTTWYVGDLDNVSICSLPSEERSYSVWYPEQELQFSTERSTEMCVTGSAEDTNNGPNESNDYDEGSQQSGSGVSAEVPPALAGQKVHYCVNVNLKEGKNLVIRDRSGTSDPYVKFRIDGKTLYKSKVVYKNLNPVWNESFSFCVRDLGQTIYVKVYDRDLRSRDFMGSSAIALDKLELDKPCEMTLRLQDPGTLEEDMGAIILEMSVSVNEGAAKRKWQLKRKGSFNKGQQQQMRAAAAQKSQVWTGVYTLVLVEGQDMPEGGQGDVFVRFRLGEQRFRSKSLCMKAKPQWRETFDFNRFEDGQLDLLVAEVFCKRGRKSEECWGQIDVDLSNLPFDRTHAYKRTVGEGKGRLVFLIKPTACPGVSLSDMNSLNDVHQRPMLEQYKLRNTVANLKDIGNLQVKVIRATDLSSTDISGKSDPFCVVELGNSKLQTPTMYKTLNPEWRTVLTFPIKDIHDVLDLTVYGEDGDKAPDFLGKVAIPLLNVSNGQQITTLLKKEDLTGPSKGSITLEISVIFNPVRAAIRTFKPKEAKFEEDSPKFNKKLLARNIHRVKRISMAMLYTLQYVQSCYQWDSTQRSITAFLIFVMMVWHFELFMLPLILLVLIGWNYYHITPGTNSHSQDLESMSVVDDDDDEDEKESEKRGLIEKIHMVQEIVVTIQTVLEEVASLGERVKNTFNWSVPFLSFLACAVLFIATVGLYWIPLRYIVLLWGLNKFTRKLRNPHAVDNNELLDFLQRVPSDVQKVQYSELRVAGVHNAQKKKR